MLFDLKKKLNVREVSVLFLLLLSTVEIPVVRANIHFDAIRYMCLCIDVLICRTSFMITKS